MQRFNPHSSHPARAVQCWQILVGKAMNRQTVTYEILGELMFHKKAHGVLAQILGHVVFYCMDHNLPPLTSIVVGKDDNESKQGIPVNPAMLGSEREAVYALDWYDVYPPTEADLAAAYADHV